MCLRKRGSIGLVRLEKEVGSYFLNAKDLREKLENDKSTECMSNFSANPEINEPEPNAALKKLEFLHMI